ncbi:MAG: cupin domain-containing protein [Pyrinomonadaceae bacterium]|nr:cupin domain-containing protein [Pyrinomonadaceae bacterium]
MKQTNQNQLVRSNEIEWKSLTEINEGDVTGVYVKSLLFDDETKRSPTILLKFEAGAKYALHDHPEGEEIFVLEGDINVGKDHLHAGDYLFTAPNNLHAARTDSGCVMLLKAPQATIFIEKRK